MLCNTELILPSAIEQYDYDCIFVIPLDKNVREEIYNNLLNLGVSKDKVLWNYDVIEKEWNNPDVGFLKQEDEYTAKKDIPGYLEEIDPHLLVTSKRIDMAVDSPLEFSLEEIIIIGMNCRKVITARSGLADVLCGNVKGMDVIYPNVGFYDLFKLEYLWEKISANVKEYVFKISDYLEKYGYNSICIYGYGEGGDRIRYSLEKEGYTVDYAVDKKQKSEDIKIYRPSEKLPKVDIMIVCVNGYKKDIVDGLKYPFDGAIVEMREIMNEIPFINL